MESKILLIKTDQNNIRAGLGHTMGYEEDLNQLLKIGKEEQTVEEGILFNRLISH
ncbi:MAG: hypothetical protein P4L69_13665 [Desulfosporosinus sp.]|nr:hypothetical protein [Desulfosporosinus sp.]